MEVDQDKDDVDVCSPLEKSPPSPVAKKPNRRSSAACARRLSRASGVGGGGLPPLEDLLASVPCKEEASTQERLTKVIQLVVNSSVRGVVGALEEDEMSDVASNVAANIRQKGLSPDVVLKVAEKLDGGLAVGGEGVVGDQVRKVREYTQLLDAEAVRWKEMIVERKNMVRNAESNARSALKGEIVVEEEQRFSLSAEEKKKLNRLPNYKAAVEQLTKHSENIELSAKAIATGSAQLKSKMEEVDESLGKATRQLIKKADILGGKLDVLESGPSLWFDAGNTQDLKQVKALRNAL